jgi:hypothetical protein
LAVVDLPLPTFSALARVPFLAQGNDNGSFPKYQSQNTLSGLALPKINLAKIQPCHEKGQPCQLPFDASEGHDAITDK